MQTFVSKMIVLDTNIIMEILEKRRHFDAALQVLSDYADQQIVVSTLTLSDVFYLIEKHPQEIKFAERLLQMYDVIGVLPEDAAWAYEHYQGRDFEDALQVASALREGCDIFLTLDSALAKKYASLPFEIRLIG